MDNGNLPGRRLPVSVFAASLLALYLAIFGGCRAPEPDPEIPAPGPASDSALYRPYWDFGPMGEELEALKAVAEDLSNAAWHGEAADAWGRVAEWAGASFGGGDPRVMPRRAARNGPVSSTGKLTRT
ncbi:MAG: hypothetical protein LBQ79_11770 [Deltaproteobacteria bacterium]|jgi:hypothetical protein|nr:hypothetical protein [Deltaproteobacteria bacterium]